jgi:ribulose-5-phosphate 4-epimerase/fuculose-1-phosphate aldolase
MDNKEKIVMMGEDIVAAGAVTSHGGNISIFDGARILITKTNVMLGHLSEDKIASCDLEESGEDNGASRELVVHRAMIKAYLKRTGAKKAAIVHTHGLYTTYWSFNNEELRPQDSEGKLIVGRTVPILVPKETIASPEAAEMLADEVSKGNDIGILRSHGPFTVAETLEGAWRMISCLEHSAHLLTLLEGKN